MNNTKHLIVIVSLFLFSCKEMPFDPLSSEFPPNAVERTLQQNAAEEEDLTFASFQNDASGTLIEIPGYYSIAKPQWEYLTVHLFVPNNANGGLDTIEIYTFPNTVEKPKGDKKFKQISENGQIRNECKIKGESCSMVRVDDISWIVVYI